jgi:two-component system, LytTR family, sensor kinase
MSKAKISKYWWFQVGGWLACAIVPLLFAYEYEYLSWILAVKMVILALLGIGLTHVLRFIFRSNNWMSLSFDRVWIILLCAVLVTTGVLNTLLLSIIYLFHLKENHAQVPVPFITRAILGSLDTLPILAVWVIIYYVWHFVEKNRNQQLESLRLESLVKELELKTIKSHINPHFIFNALNSIRALVDENPGRARTAITELSNILRSSMQTEKTETVPLEKELAIVKDYLALEKIRFEERLRVELDIDEDTLEEPVPIMMLQTLVENAIKHGISKRLDGGVIRVRSYFRGRHHVLVVQNTGHLNGSGHMGEEGFGLMSTQSRLSILYGAKANFEIRDVSQDTVEAKISIPVEMN